MGQFVHKRFWRNISCRIDNNFYYYKHRSDPSHRSRVENFFLLILPVPTPCYLHRHRVGSVIVSNLGSRHYIGHTGPRTAKNTIGYSGSKVNPHYIRNNCSLRYPWIIYYFSKCCLTITGGWYTVLIYVPTSKSSHVLSSPGVRTSTIH